MQWKNGDRVECRWQGGPIRYAGTVDEVRGGQVFILYDDGDEEWTTPALCRRLPEPPDSGGGPELQVGDRVEARWLGGPTWYPGRVGRRHGRRVHIEYDDGDREWTTPALCRKVAGALKAGDRVLARFRGDRYWYPATVRRDEDERYYVVMDNGDKQWTRRKYLLEMDVETGDRVHCRRADGEKYAAGRVKQLDGARLLVHFEDGREEWVELARCRVTR